MRRSRKLALAIAVTASATLAITQAAAAVAVPAAVAAGQQPLTAQEAAALSQDANTPVIVLMRNQPAPAAKNSPAAASRAQGITSAQAPLVSELSQVHAKHVQTYTLANALAATVSKGEAARLAANPNVASVIPDSLIKGAPPAASQLASSSSSGSASPSDIPGTCPAPGAKPLLEPEALAVTHTDSDDPNAKTARSLGYTGAGVKVAWIAEGIDTNNPDFIRADGSHVFGDFQDFTGDGPNAPTSAGEAFLDASAIAAQGRQVYDISNFGAHSLSSPCNIRIEGVAPGASLYGFKVFGNTNFSTTSAILQSIQWAVNVDHVDVINESFGFDPFPDSSSQDAVRLFDDAAVAAGASVTVSTGDAGPTNTQGSPASDPNVIATGASTTFRWLAQTDYAAAQQFAPNGWLNDNISELSSSGVTASGRTIDLLAPGDSSFALCTANTDLYQGCTNFVGQPSNVERSGGTSESAPLTAGAAALVIQAYRHAHNGASPSPALVKQILVSTADDLSVPGVEQGTGRLDTYKAVQAALSVHDANGAPAATGSTLLVNQSQLDAAGAQGSQQHFQLKVTNNGASAQNVQLSGRGFGAPKNTSSGSVTLSDTASPHFADWAGANNNYGVIKFNVPANSDRLTASIAYPGAAGASLNARVRLILIDPNGKMAAHSLPQGVGNAGFDDVRFPTAGTWTAVIFGRVSTVGGTVGVVPFTESTENITGFGSVSQSVLHLAPGQTGTVSVTATTPAQPGDGSGSVVLNAGAGGQTSVPVVLRSLVGVSHGSGSFNGTLTGGNGRQSDLGQENFYQFDVPAGQHDLSASVDLTNDAADNVAAFLIDPRGQGAAAGTNLLPTSYNLSTQDGTLQPALQTDLYVRNPHAGRWTLVVNFADPVVGDELSQPFAGRVRFNSVDAHAAGLPNSSGTKLAAGHAVTVPVTVHNTGTAAENFFVDPRLNAVTGMRLAAVQPATLPLPMPGSASSPSWLVPSETSAVAVIGTATQPTMFDFGPEAGDPDLPSIVNGTTAIGVAHGNPLASGLWAVAPSEVGPTPAGGGAAGSVSFDLVTLSKAFDPAVSSPATDLWQGSL
ncbi:MAG TPA: S8 family serine peptidase, partial [Pseudonocardiaceae bacterium]|nr:S8 family serine peptidase [Pseudonocardiaceae bacterium]